MWQERGEEVEFGRLSMTSGNQGNSWLSGCNMGVSKDEPAWKVQESQQGTSQPQKERFARKAMLENKSPNSYNIDCIGTRQDQLEVFQKIFIGYRH